MERVTYSRAKGNMEEPALPPLDEPAKIIQLLELILVSPLIHSGHFKCTSLNQRSVRHKKAQKSVCAGNTLDRRPEASGQSVWVWKRLANMQTSNEITACKHVTKALAVGA